MSLSLQTIWKCLCELRRQVADHTVRLLTIEERARYAYVAVWAEQNGTLAGGRWNYSFGNGNEHVGAGINDWGYVAHLEWELVSLSVGMRATNTAATVIRVTVNGATTPAIVTVPGSQTKVVQTVALSGVAGDTLNFQTVTPGGGNDVVVSALIRYTLP